MKILIGADLVPTKSNEELFKMGNAEKLIGKELMKLFRDADYRIFNLEVPLTDDKRPIKKCGPNLIASTDTILGYKAIGVDLLTLANNHILDHGANGLDSTIRLLSENNISFLGAGKNINEARRPYFISLYDKKIGVYACAEHEFSIASNKTAGANPFDPLETPDCIAALKKQCDFLIVLYHGGKEHYRYPSPYLQKVCRRLVEKGADLVICQHSHCIGCEEKYNGATIIYGQGNFLFDCSESEFWQTSLLVALNSDFNVTYIPIVKNGNTVRLAKENAKKILDDFAERSKQIAKSGFVEENYKKFAKSMACGYLIEMSGVSKNIFFRVINKLTGYHFAKVFIKKKYNNKTLLSLQNFIECEAHRELLLSGLKEEIK